MTEKEIEYLYSLKIHQKIKLIESRLFLDIYVKDKDELVRQTVAQQGCPEHLDILVNDECEWVRYEVARHGYGVDTLINDEHWIVRTAVAKYGYRTDILINDESECVRDEAIKYAWVWTPLMLNKNIVDKQKK